MKTITIIIFNLLIVYLFGQNHKPFPLKEDPNISWFEPANTPYIVGKYDKVEVGISLPEDIQYKIDNFIFKGDSPKSINPFLEWEIKIIAEFFHDGILQKQTDGFYYKEYERDLSNLNVYKRTWNNTGEGYGLNGKNYNFRIRTALDKIGKWTCRIKVILPNNEITFNEFDILVTTSTNPGYLKVGKNKRYFTLNDQSFYFVGQNVNWPTKTGFCINRNGTVQNLCQPFVDGDANCGNDIYPPDSYLNFYKKLDTLAEHVNFIRTMMVPWSWDFEFEKVGNYSSRMNIAWEMDRFFELCKEKGIYVNFDLSWGAEFANPTAYGGAEWDWYDHPDDQIAAKNEKFYNYKIKFGLETITDFRTNAEVKKYYAQKLRYFIARYGYATNLSIIEVANEMNGKEYETFEGRQSVREWHDFVCSYLKDTLHADQLTAVNYGNGYEVCTQNNICSGGKSDGDFSYSSDKVDVASINFYSGASYNKQYGFSCKFNRKQEGKEFNKWYYNLNKPIIIGETGFSENLSVCSPKIFDGYDNAALLSVTGIAGVIVWDDRPEYYENYHYLTNFMNELDLDGDNYQPILPNFAAKYPHQIRNKMIRKDEKAIFFYLKSTERNPKVVGAINNSTMNEYSMRNPFWDDGYEANGKELPPKNKWKDTLPCASPNLNMPCDDLEWDFYNNKMNYGLAPFNTAEIVIPSRGQQLKIYDLDFGKFNSKYYGGFNFNLLDSNTSTGLFKKLDHPPIDEENRIMLFTLAKENGEELVFQKNQDTYFTNASVLLNISTEKLLIEGKWAINLTTLLTNLTYEIYNNEGKLIQSDNVKSAEQTIHVSYSKELILILKDKNGIVYSERIQVI